MNIYIVMILSFLVVFLFIVVFFLKSSSNKQSNLKTSNRRKTEESKAYLDIQQLTDSVTSLKKDRKVEMISFIEKERYSPERPITKEDAALIDIIRQNPELPTGIVQLSQILKDPEARIKKIVKIISTYPILSAKILRVVNSPAYSPHKKITSVQHAVVILGFNNLWLLVNQLLATIAVQNFSELSNEEMKRLWRHGAAAATCAKHLLIQLDMNTSDIAPTVYTCSLLHDVGKFLLRGLGNKDVEIKDDSPCKNPSVIGEDSFYGIDHCRLAYLITTYWGLPEILCTTISYHHHPSFSNWEDIPQHARVPTILVSLSDMLANLSGYYDMTPCTLDIHPMAIRYLGLDKKWDINNILTNELYQDLKETEKLIEAATTV